MSNKKLLQKQQEIQKDFALINEVDTSARLIKLGFGEIQNIDTVNDFYFLPFQLLSQGFERLMKCYICLGYYEKHKTFPSSNDIKTHDLTKLLDKILRDYFVVGSDSRTKWQEVFLKNDEDLKKAISIISEFGKYARYYNLDVITGTQENNSLINPKDEWADFINTIAKKNDIKYCFNDYDSYPKFYEQTNRQVIILLEKFVATLSLQFRRGCLGQKGNQVSVFVSEFLKMDYEDFGKIDYRKTTTKYKEEKRNIVTVKEFEKISSKYNEKVVSKKIIKDEYQDKWPFFCDEVTVQLRQNHWAVIIIDGFVYSLNGLAKGKYKIEDPHEGGMIPIGVDISPFLKIAEGLKS